MIVPFKYYLHDAYTGSERAEFILRQTDLEMSQEEFLELTGRPFYEVTLSCLLDTETGQITVQRADL
jgi:ABC-type uncharacterized transport system ATPase component